LLRDELAGVPQQVAQQRHRLRSQDDLIGTAPQAMLRWVEAEVCEGHKMTWPPHATPSKFRQSGKVERENENDEGGAAS
jgi:hypothetical protein